MRGGSVMITGTKEQALADASRELESSEADYNDAATDVQNALQQLNIFGVMPQDLKDAEEQNQPIRPELPFPEVRRFAKALAEEVERRVGDQDVATTTWKVADREGVFVDFGQNARDRTIASAYSIRPTPDARVSAPLRWEEVTGVDPGAFTVETMRERIAKLGDLTAGIWRRRVSLAPRFAALELEPSSAPLAVSPGGRTARRRTAS